MLFRSCASILWRTAEKAADAAVAMQVTAQDLLALRVIDRIVPEPVGGAHRDKPAASASLKQAISDELAKLAKMTSKDLRAARADKFLAIGR